MNNLKPLPTSQLLSLSVPFTFFPRNLPSAQTVEHPLIHPK